MTEVTHIPLRVRQIANLIHQMDAEERRWLIRLAPELQTPPIPELQQELYAYFEPRLRRLAETTTANDDEPFIGGLSIVQFFALPEDEQLRLWELAHTTAEHELNQPEIPVQAHARPAR